MKLYQKTTFWENIKRTLATFAGPAVVGLHELDAADGWMLFAGACSLLGGVLSIWMADSNQDGEVDLFEDEKKDS